MFLVYFERIVSYMGVRILTWVEIWGCSSYFIYKKYWRGKVYFSFSLSLSPSAKLQSLMLVLFPIKSTISNSSALVMTSQSNRKSKYGGLSCSFFTTKKCPKRSLYFMVMEMLEMNRCAGMWVYRKEVASFKR